MFKTLAVLSTFLVFTPTWATEDTCATLLVRLAIVTKFMGGPYPSSLTREYQHHGQTVATFEFSVQPQDYIPPKMFITLPGSDPSTAKTLADN